MKVITKSVIVENQEFVLIQNTHEGKQYFGTIPCTELDANGCMIRELNGMEMCISFKDAADAIHQRIIREGGNRIMAKYIAQGMDKMSAILAMAGDPEYLAL